MTMLQNQLNEKGIRLQSPSPGTHYATCPSCSAQRKPSNRKKPCLGVTVDDDGRGAVWRCNHCEWTGGVIERDGQHAARRKQSGRPRETARPALQTEPPNDDFFEFFKERGIPEDIVRRNRISLTRRWMPGCKAEVAAIAFPYFRKGKIINVKYRSFDKHFAQEKGAEKIFYGLDDIAGSETIIIVEGEMDKLALEVAGFQDVLSVPDGAPAKARNGVIDPEQDAKFEYVWNCKDELANATKIIFAVDNDDPGRALEEELARRIGRERCWRVAWPNLNDAVRKDANEVLLEDGADVLRECIDAAQPYPIKSLHELGAFVSETLSLYHDGPARTFSTGWASLDKYMTIRPGLLSVVTGIPGSGKSEFVDALMINLANKFGWRFAVCSFENPPDEHISKLAEKHLGRPFWEGPTKRMTETELRVEINWLKEHFYFIRSDDEAPTIDWILDAAKAAVMRYGIRGLVIDPYNEIEHRRPGAMSETEYVSLLLGKVKRFAQVSGVHVWFIAHPAKMQRDHGKIPVPNLYDISGSANWSNKADYGIVVHRNWNEGSDTTEIYVRKVRFKSTGCVGVVSHSYDRVTGRYARAS